MSRNTLSPDELQTIAHDAYLFCFPLNYYYHTVYSQVLDPTNPKSIGGFGMFRHDPLATPADKEYTMANVDTPYSWAWVDLRSEPWVLVMPPADGDRFYTSVWGDLFGHIIAYPDPSQQARVAVPTCWRRATGRAMSQSRSAA